MAQEFDYEKRLEASDMLAEMDTDEVDDFYDLLDEDDDLDNTWGDDDLDEDMDDEIDEEPNE